MMGKRIVEIVCMSVSVACLVVSCGKESAPAGKEIRIGVSNPINVTTKVTPVTVIPATLYWGASRGSAGSETSVWACTSGAVSGGEIATGKYQDPTPVAYNYYISNRSFTIGAASTNITADGSTDVIVGSVRSCTDVNPSIELTHIFARTGTLSFTSQAGYTMTNVSWSIKGKGAVNGTAGTFNLSTMSWTSSSGSLPETVFTSSSDIWLIPSVYTVSCTYTLTKGDYTKTFTKSGDVTFLPGKVTNISGSASGGDATDITFLVSINGWDDYDAGEVELTEGS